jgi:hypothetical protein
VESCREVGAEVGVVLVGVVLVVVEGGVLDVGGVLLVEGVVEVTVGVLEVGGAEDVVGGL